MEEINENFLESYKIDYKKEGMIEKKGHLDYLSWAHAQKIMREKYPQMRWKLVQQENGALHVDGMIKIAFDKGSGEFDEEQWFPILKQDKKGYQPVEIKDINQQHINTAQMRAFTKGFAMITGHALSLYTGEDLKDLEIKELNNEFKKLEKKTTKQLEKMFKETKEFKEHSEEEKEKITKKMATLEEEKLRKTLITKILKDEGEKNE